jgi:CAAX protease family protein
MSTIVTWTRQHRLTAFFGLAFAFSWWPWPFYAAGLAPAPFYAIGPVIAALIVIGLTDGRPGYRELLTRLTHWRVGWRWWVVALATPLAVLAVAALANATIWGAPTPDLGSLTWADIGLFFAFRFVNPLDGPFGEEPGWRAYAVPRLQQRWSPLRAGATLGVVVALWHLPLVVASGTLAPFGIAVTFAITLVYVWLFNRTGGSALMTLVFHVAQGTISYTALGFTGADADRMDWLTGTLWCLIAIALVTLDRKAWRTAPIIAHPPAAGCARSAWIAGAPRDVVGDRRGDVEGRREAGVVGEPGDVEVGVLAGAVPPSGQEVEPRAGGDRLQGVGELAVGGRPAAGDVVGVVRQGFRGRQEGDRAPGVGCVAAVEAVVGMRRPRLLTAEHGADVRGMWKNGDSGSTSGPQMVPIRSRIGWTPLPRRLCVVRGSTAFLKAMIRCGRAAVGSASSSCQGISLRPM